MSRGIPIEATTGESGADAAQTVSTPARGRRTLKSVMVAYSSAVTVDVTVTINADAGAAFDTRIATLELTANQFGFYLPEQDIPLADGDAIDVLAPAGGGVITSAVQINVEPE